MSLLVDAIVREVANLNEKNVKMNVIGNIDSFPHEVQLKLKEAIYSTSSNTGLNLILALSYSGRWDILQATRQIIRKALAGEITEEQLDEQFDIEPDCEDPWSEAWMDANALESAGMGEDDGCSDIDW